MMYKGLPLRSANLEQAALIHISPQPTSILDPLPVMSSLSVQERDLVVAINESSDEAFVLKDDLEGVKIGLNRLAPRVDLKPYAVSCETFIFPSTCVFEDC